MGKWYIKEFSKLTNVTVRTLHHYDQIDLLKPSVRYPNGYRVYSESDLIKLQQITALRFFGFSLSVIKDIMKKNINVIEHLKAQKEHMQTQILHLQDASKTLNAIIDDVLNNKEQLYSPELLKHFVELQQNRKQREIVHYRKKWEMLHAELQLVSEQKPEGLKAKRIVRRWLNMLKDLDTKPLEFKAAVYAVPIEASEKPPLSPFIREWLDKAISYEKKNRITRKSELT